MATDPTPPKVVVVVYGGLVQEVYADRPVEVVVLDYDQDDTTEDDVKNDPYLTRIPERRPGELQQFVRATAERATDIAQMPMECEGPLRHALETA